MRALRVEFYKLETDEKTKQETEVAVGFVDLLLPDNFRDSIAGLAYRRANRKCLEANILKYFPR